MALSSSLRICLEKYLTTQSSRTSGAAKCTTPSIARSWAMTMGSSTTSTQTGRGPTMTPASGQTPRWSMSSTGSGSFWWQVTQRIWSAKRASRRTMLLMPLRTHQSASSTKGIQVSAWSAQSIYTAAEAKVARPQISTLQVFVCLEDGHCLLCSSQHWPSLGWAGARFLGGGRDGPPLLLWPPLSSQMRMKSPPWFRLAARLSGIACVSTCLANGPVFLIRYFYPGSWLFNLPGSWISKSGSWKAKLFRIQGSKMYRIRNTGKGFGKQVSTCASPDLVPYRYRSMGFGKQLLISASPEKILYHTGTIVRASANSC